MGELLRSKVWLSDPKLQRCTTLQDDMVKVLGAIHQPEQITPGLLSKMYLTYQPASTKKGQKKYNNPQNPNDLVCIGEENIGSDLSLSNYNPELELVRKPKFFVGLKNLGATCYMNCMLQALYHNTQFRQGVYFWKPSSDQEEPGDKVMKQLQLLFAYLQEGKKSYYDPTPFTIETGLQTSVQQDAQEFFKVLITYLEDIFDRSSISSVKKLIQNQFCGTMAYVTQCQTCQHSSKHKSSFYELDMTIENIPTLAQSIDTYIQKEILDGNNQYDCSHCESKQDAARFIELVELPQVLNFQLMRFVYDYEKDVKKKIKSNLEFPEILDMSSYLRRTEKCQTTETLIVDNDLEHDSSTNNTIQEEEKSNDILESDNVESSSKGAKKTRNGANKPSNKNNARSSSNSNSSGTSNSSSSNKPQTTKKTSSSSPNNSQEDTENVYVLSYVLVHKGSSAYGGHYIAFVRDEATGNWWKFNDESVEPVANLAKALASNSDDISVTSKTSSKKTSSTAPVEIPDAEEPIDLDTENEPAQKQKRSKNPKKSGLAAADPKPSKKTSLKSSSAYMIGYTKVSRDHCVPIIPDEILEEVVTHNNDFAKTVDKCNSLSKEIDESKALIAQQYQTLLDVGLGAEPDQEDLPVLPSRKTQTSKQTKINSEQSKMEVSDDVSQMDHPANQLNHCYWIVTAWLESWLRATPESQSGIVYHEKINEELLCSHGLMDPMKIDKAKRISGVAWDTIKTFANVGPALTNQSLCIKCVLDILDYARNKMDSQKSREEVLAALKSINSNSGSNVEPTYWISKDWIAEYSKKTSIPDPTINSAIQCPHGKLSTDSKARKRIPASLWKTLTSLFPSAIEFRSIMSTAAQSDKNGLAGKPQKGQKSSKSTSSIKPKNASQISKSSSASSNSIDRKSKSNKSRPQFDQEAKALQKKLFQEASKMHNNVITDYKQEDGDDVIILGEKLPKIEKSGAVTTLDLESTDLPKEITVDEKETESEQVMMNVESDSIEKMEQMEEAEEVQEVQEVQEVEEVQEVQEVEEVQALQELQATNQTNLETRNEMDDEQQNSVLPCDPTPDASQIENGPENVKSENEVRYIDDDDTIYTEEEAEQLDCCPICFEELQAQNQHLDEKNKERGAEKKSFLQLFRNVPSSMASREKYPGYCETPKKTGAYYLVSLEWLVQWKNYLENLDIPHVGPVKNDQFVCTHKKWIFDPLTLLDNTRDNNKFAIVTPQQWHELLKVYGGGPAMQLKWNGNETDLSSLICLECQKQYLMDLDSKMTHFVNESLQFIVEEGRTNKRKTTAVVRDPAKVRSLKKRFVWGVSYSDSVHKLKLKIYQESDIPPAEQSISANGIQFTDDETLLETYNVRADSILIVRHVDPEEREVYKAADERNAGFGTTVLMGAKKSVQPNEAPSVAEDAVIIENAYENESQQTEMETTVNQVSEIESSPNPTDTESIQADSPEAPVQKDNMASVPEFPEIVHLESDLIPWKCTKCSFVNPPRFLTCQECQNMKESRSGGATCPQCTCRLLSPDVDNCHVCDYDMRPNQVEILSDEEEVPAPNKKRGRANDSEYLPASKRQKRL